MLWATYLLISLPLRFARNLWGQFRLISCLIFNESMRIDKLIMIGIIPPHSFLSGINGQVLDLGTRSAWICAGKQVCT